MCDNFGNRLKHVVYASRIIFNIETNWLASYIYWFFSTQFVDWWTPIILVTVLGPVFALIFFSVGTCFCCCRLCGKCRRKHHGKKYDINDDDNNYKCFIALCIILIFCLCPLM